MATIVAAALLVFGVAVVCFLTILALGIHGYRLSRCLSLSRRLADAPRTRIEALTRRVLGLTVRNGNPDHDNQEGRHVNA
jgi:hypothetical protein